MALFALPAIGSLVTWGTTAVAGWAVWDWFGGADEQTAPENPMQTLNLTKLALGALGLFLAYKLIKSVIN